MKAAQQNERAERTLKNKFHQEQLIEAFLRSCHQDWSRPYKS